MKNGRVCIMTSVYGAKDVRIYEKEAKTLAKNGYEVILINSYEEGREYGVVFRRADVPNGRLARMAAAWIIYFRRAYDSQAAICHFHDPELIMAGLLLRLMGRKVIYDVHEDLPKQLLYKPYLTGEMRRFFSKAAELFEERAANFFNVNLCATEQIAKRFENAVVLHNYPSQKELERYKKQIIPYKQRKKLFCYIGAISEHRGIFNILDAVQGSDVSVMLAGSFEDENLKMRCQIHKGFKNVEYMGVLNREEVFSLLGECRGGLLLLEATQNYLESMPIKMFEYLAAGVPVICSDFPLWRQLLGDAAIFVDPNNPAEVLDAMCDLLKNEQKGEELSKKGIELAEKHFVFENEQHRLLNIYGKLNAQNI
ncbi:MAG: glycosyltransferase [Oscillospiraceae bacterium]|nr:glycosyltransferase [Oscillospiraceae bacterium]